MLRLPRSLASDRPGPLSMTKLMKGQIKLTHYPWLLAFSLNSRHQLSFQLKLCPNLFQALVLPDPICLRGATS
jgi:hypothetical protein